MCWPMAAAIAAGAIDQFPRWTITTIYSGEERATPSRSGGRPRRPLRPRRATTGQTPSGFCVIGNFRVLKRRFIVRRQRLCPCRLPACRLVPVTVSSHGGRWSHGMDVRGVGAAPCRFRLPGLFIWSRSRGAHGPKLADPVSPTCWSIRLSPARMATG